MATDKMQGDSFEMWLALIQDDEFRPMMVELIRAQIDAQEANATGRRAFAAQCEASTDGIAKQEEQHLRSLALQERDAKMRAAAMAGEKEYRERMYAHSAIVETYYERIATALERLVPAPDRTVF